LLEIKVEQVIFKSQLHTHFSFFVKAYLGEKSTGFICFDFILYIKTVSFKQVSPRVTPKRLNLNKFVYLTTLYRVENCVYNQRVYF